MTEKELTKYKIRLVGDMFIVKEAHSYDLIEGCLMLYKWVDTIRTEIFVAASGKWLTIES